MSVWPDSLSKALSGVVSYLQAAQDRLEQSIRMITSNEIHMYGAGLSAGATIPAATLPTAYKQR